MRLPALATAARTADAEVVSAATTTPQQKLVLWTFFVSGLLSLALEIIWFRMLVVFLRPTAYAFTIMLACVLGGIALGSAIASPLLRRRALLTSSPHPGRGRPPGAAFNCCRVAAAIDTPRRGSARRLTPISRR